MIQSMTGYGKADCEYAEKKISVEIKSLNGKQQDLTTRIAGQYREKEVEIRNKLTRELERGKIELVLTSDKSLNGASQINAELVEKYYCRIREIADNLKVEIPANWLDTVLRFPDVLRTENTETDANEWDAVSAAIDLAIARLREFRLQEGKMLYDVFMQKINNIRHLLGEINQYENERIEKIKAKIEENLSAICENVEFDRNRFEQELIYYIEKLDINEEKSRLANHLDYFTKTMDGEVSQGKKLGFIAQEIGREINTLGSKSNHSEMQKTVVVMKDELEQIKEQVLNVL